MGPIYARTHRFSSKVPCLAEFLPALGRTVTVGHAELKLQGPQSHKDFRDILSAALQCFGSFCWYLYLLHSASHQVSGTTGVGNRAGAAKRRSGYVLSNAPSILPGCFEEDFAAGLVGKGHARPG